MDAYQDEYQYEDDEDKDIVRELKIEEEAHLLEAGPQDTKKEFIKRDMIGQTCEHVLKQIAVKKTT